MPLLKTLLNAGLLPSDAQALDAHYGNLDPDEFLDGLEQIARVLITKQANLAPPTTEPWLGIHGYLLQNNGQDLDQVFAQYISNLDPSVQLAVSGAVSIRVGELQQWYQQSQAAQGKRRKTAQYIKALNNVGYKFKFNLCTQEIEVNGKRITDSTMQEIRTKVRDVNIWEVQVVEDAYSAEAWKNRYHPIKGYLLNLKFNGGDPIAELSNYFVDEHGVFGTWLRHWLVGAVARAMQETQNRVLILDGRQNIGKSHFTRWLANPMPEYYHEGPILPEDKDCKLRRLSVWVWEVNEFGNTARKADREALKAFLTTQTVRERRAYGRYDILGTAMSSFIGTVNNESGILSDPTGSRRFMISHLLDIDWSYTKMDVDQVWAQAMDLYLAGERWELSPDERTRSNEINADYEMVDIVEETIIELFEVNPKENWWMSTLDILTLLKDPLRGNLKPGTEIDARKLAGALTRLGLQKPKASTTSSNRARGYTGIKRKGP